MKFTLLSSAFAAVLGLALASVPVTVQAQTTTPTTDATAPAPTATPPKAKKPHAPDYRGILTAIDTAGSTITVNTSKKDPTKVIVLKIDPAKTKILKDKQPATLADFTVGEQVSGSYTKEADGTFTAASLHFKTPKAPKTPATTAAAPATPSAPATPAMPAAPAAQ